MSNEKDNVLEILDDVERKVEEFRAAALRLAEDKVELERSVAFVESLTRGMPEMSEVSPIIMMSLGIIVLRCQAISRSNPVGPHFKINLSILGRCGGGDRQR